MSTVREIKTTTGVQIELTTEEAEVLVTVFGRMNGDVRITGKIRQQLKDVGIRGTTKYTVDAPNGTLGVWSKRSKSYV